MSDTIESKPGINFWIIGGAALIWNLIGLVFYIGHVSISPEALAAMTEAHQEFLLATPVWATSAFAIAVNAGVLGCILLLLRKSLAIPVFVVSLLAIVLQDLDAFVLRNAYSILGVSSLIIPSMVFVIGVAILLYARAAKRCGWLN
jgi:hypothetical protein